MKKVLLWILAVVLTLSAAVYQRMTGPTYEKRVKIEIDNQTYHLKLIRSQENIADALVLLEIPDTAIAGGIWYRRYPTGEPWTRHSMVRLKSDPEILAGPLPAQPAAGKLEYYIVLEKNGELYPFMKDEPVIIRFKGPVPSYILVPHVLFMFTAMLLSTAAMLFAIGGLSSFRSYTRLTFWLLLAGGMILGPVVQKFAFGELWTGIPFGWDLTDNKTLIAFMGFLVAFLGNRKKERPYLTIIAGVLLLLVYSIPHSMFGSELDYEKGEIIQGILYPILFR